VLAARGDLNALRHRLEQQRPASESHELALFERMRDAVSLSATRRDEDARPLYVACARAGATVPWITYMVGVGWLIDGLIGGGDLAVLEE
jgi:hypothetical protein